MSERVQESDQRSGTGADVEPDLRRLQVLYTGIGAGVGTLLPFLVLYLTWRGLSPAQAGLVMGLMSGVGVLAVPAWGALADTALGPLRALRLSCLLAAAASLLLLRAGSVVWALVLCAALLAAVRAPGEALADTLSVQLLGPRASHLYGRIRLWSSLGFAVAVAVWSVVLDHNSLALVLVAYPLVLLLQVACTAGRRWPLPSRTARSAPPSGTQRDLLHPRLLVLLAGAMLFGVAMGASLTTVPLRITDLGGGVLAVGASSVLGALAEMPVMRSSGALRHRLGAGAVFLLGGALFAVAVLLYGLLTAPSLLVVDALLRGAGYGLVYVALVTSAGELVPRHRQATGQALLQTTLMGVAPIAGSALGGVVYEHQPALVLYGVAAALALAGAAIARVAAARPDQEVG